MKLVNTGYSCGFEGNDSSRQMDTQAWPKKKARLEELLHSKDQPRGKGKTQRAAAEWRQKGSGLGEGSRLAPSYKVGLPSSKPPVANMYVCVRIKYDNPSNSPFNITRYNT